MTVKDTDMIEVRNLTGSSVVFKDEETHRRYPFAGYEKKRVSADVIRRLNWRKGGHVILTDYLCVENDELAKEIGVSDDILEHEYKWTKEDINNVLSTGSIDELKDALDFAPEGIISTIVDEAVETKLNDVNKREAIKEATGQDITSKITLKEQMEGFVQSDNEKPKARRTTSTTERKTRRTTVKNTEEA